MFVCHDGTVCVCMVRTYSSGATDVVLNLCVNFYSSSTWYGGGMSPAVFGCGCS